MCQTRFFPSEGCFCLSMTHRQLIRFSPDHYRDIPPQQKECLSLLLQSTAETEKRQSSIMKCSGSLQMTHHTSRCFSSVLPSDLSPHFISRRRQKQQMYSEEMLPKPSSSSPPSPRCYWLRVGHLGQWKAVIGSCGRPSVSVGMRSGFDG